MTAPADRISPADPSLTCRPAPPRPRQRTDGALRSIHRMFAVGLYSSSDGSAVVRDPVHVYSSLVLLSGSGPSDSRDSIDGLSATGPISRQRATIRTRTRVELLAVGPYLSAVDQIMTEIPGPGVHHRAITPATGPIGDANHYTVARRWAYFRRPGQLVSAIQTERAWSADPCSRRRVERIPGPKLGAFAADLFLRTLGGDPSGGRDPSNLCSPPSPLPHHGMLSGVGPIAKPVPWWGLASDSGPTSR